MAFKLRDYQSRDVERIVSAFPTSRRVMYTLPVGGGKTVVAGAVMSRFRRALVLAHRGELLEQMSRTAERFGLGADRVTLRTPGKAKRLSDADLSAFELVVVDEAHRAGGPEYRSILERVTAPILGLSASPYRRDGLEEDFDELIEGPSVQELVDAGHILEPRCWSVPEDREPDLKGVKRTAGDYNVGELERAVNKPHLVGDIVREWSEHAAGLSTLVFATSIKHAESIAEAFRGAGIDARIVHGKTKAKERKDALSAFEAGGFPVLVNVLLLTEGIDIHRIDCLILARPTRSIVLFIQATGRAMRISPTGRRPIILDHSGAVRRHGLPTTVRRWSLKPVPKDRDSGGGKRDMSKRCSACGTMTHLSAVECAHCGAKFRIEDPGTRLEEVKERRCDGCDTAIGAKSKSGLCRRCAAKRAASLWTPEQRAKVSSGGRRGCTSRIAAKTPEERAEWSRNANAQITPDQRSRNGAAGARKSLEARLTRGIEYEVPRE